MSKNKIELQPIDKKKPQEDCCFNCHYFRGDPQTCHRMPPFLMQTARGPVTSFVPVKPEEWCGEYKRAESNA